MKDKRNVDDEQDKPDPQRPSGGKPGVDPQDGEQPNPPTNPGDVPGPGKKP